jgi:hypothetical protein
MTVTAAAAEPSDVTRTDGYHDKARPGPGGGGAEARRSPSVTSQVPMERVTIGLPGTWARAGPAVPPAHWQAARSAAAAVRRSLLRDRDRRVACQ